MVPRYPVACVPGVTPCSHPLTTADLDNFDEASNTRGLTVAGLWTHGKMVLLDNLLNNVDYGLRVPDKRQRMLALYQPGTGPGGTGTGSVRAGSGRDNGVDLGLPGTNNITFVDSLENLFEHIPRARPLTVRDVVWTVNNGRGSDEVAFDDYIDPDAFIVSEMSGSMSFSGGVPASDFHYHDGFARTGPFTGSGFSDAVEVRVQNAATPLPDRWVVPAYGKVTGGARLEPGQRASLAPAALTLNAALTAAADPRRSPLQPPRLITGNIPAGHVPETGLPASAVQAPAAGQLLDEWMFPSP